ncbi:hypothetical protein J2X55_002418 [Microbacterium sp. 1154]|uniref:hypothetical protein n=1 Tax=Microbacterium sp. 1154 TaxID=2817733 RepID=UPI00285745EE|nr:hypothetical protein [Microbacterium sp. 1154]MDR6691495.1 hypothetical protein [Microbacterium sp. 1154]
MTRERIDHLKQAADWLDGAERPDITDALASQMAGIAQVHATLALVEQQRIANLIAVWMGPDIAVEGLAEDGLSFDAVRDAIREGLSL